MSDIAGAIKEVFGFLREWNNADQQQKRYALRRIRRIQRAADIAEDVFGVVDDMLVIVKCDDPAFKKLETRYRKLVQKFNRLD